MLADLGAFEFLIYLAVAVVVKLLLKTVALFISGQPGYGLLVKSTSVSFLTICVRKFELLCELALDLQVILR